MNKRIIGIIIVTLIFISTLVYMNFFTNDFRISNFKSIDEVEVLNEYKDSRTKACYGNKVKCNSVKPEIEGVIDTKKLGEYKVKYVFTYKNKKKVLNKKIVVKDTIAPSLEVEVDNKNVCKNNKINNIKLYAHDNYDGDISNNIKYKIELNKIKYVVEDSSKNKTEKEFDITYNDKNAPELILNGGSTIFMAMGSKYKEPGYTSIDFCDGDITKDVKVTNNLNANKKGSYTIKYESVDSSGNKTIKERTVKVYDKNDYNSGIVSGKIVYLTFDDGPGVYTNKLLDILDKYNVKVTFFVTGGGEDSVILREHKSGHTVGLHANNHNYAVIYSSDQAYYNDLQTISDRVKRITGVESKVIRFPGGSSNTISRHYSVGIMSRVTKGVEERGYKYFDWNVDSNDAGGTKTSAGIYNNVTSRLRENRANVVLMHDIKSYTVDAIENIIIYGLSNGYTFLPLTVDSPTVHQGINN